MTELPTTKGIGSEAAEQVITKLAPGAAAVLIDAAGIVGSEATPTRTTALAPVLQPPSGTVLHPTMVDQHGAGRRPWFLGQLWSEIRTVGQMYLDPHYRVSRTAQFALPTILILFGLNYFFFNVMLITIPVLTPVAERIVCVFLGILFYKILTRELARYRAVLDYLAQYAPR